MSYELRDDIAPQIPHDRLSGRDGPYLAEPGLVDAANVALSLELPLLLTGQPGCGKTDFAFVVANALARLGTGIPEKPLECHIRSDSRARDLLYHYDPLLRFTDGQHGGETGRAKAEDARNYIELRGLGLALTSRTRHVVLIDEIDKAPRDLPNDLLREMDRGEFEIAEIPADVDRDLGAHTGSSLRRIMTRPLGDDGRKLPKPVVVITSNVERQLPEAFLRRCIFYHIRFPGQERLRKIVEARHPDGPTRLFDSVIPIFLAAREIPNLTKKPSTAEMLDWIAALQLFKPGGIRPILDAFAKCVDRDGKVHDARLRWHRLPAVGCLFKLREDLDLAGKWYAKASEAG